MSLVGKYLQKYFKFHATKNTSSSSLTKTSRMKNFVFLFISLFCLIANSQISGKVIDAATGEPIPYANIQCGAKNMISNTEGFFSLSETEAGNNPVVISYIGYAVVQTTADAIKGNHTVKLSPAFFELDNVNVREQPSAESIMATVRKNLKQNYMPSEKPFESKIFMRESNAFIPKILDIELDKSTGFTKNNLKAFNTEFAKFTNGVINYPPKAYTDVLFNYYGLPEKKSYKMDVSKATRLTDEKRATSLEGMEKMQLHYF
jgi:hypothetical protein